MDDLIERLRNFEGSDELGNGDFSLLHEAADEIEVLRAEAAAWRELSDRMEVILDYLQAENERLLTALRNTLPVLEFEAETRGSNDSLYEIPVGPVLDAARAAIACVEGPAGGSQ